MNGTDWAAALGNLPSLPEVTVYRWPMNPRTCPPAGWVDLIHDATWEGEE